MWKSVVIALLSGMSGGAIVWLAQAGSFRLTPANMTYADLAAVALTAVGVIVAIFGGVLALAAIWGFNQLKRDAIDAAEKAGAKEIQDQISGGVVFAKIKGEIERMTTEELSSDRMEQRIRTRIDEVAFGRPDADKLLDADAEEQR